MPQRWSLRSSFLKIYKKANKQYNHLGQQTFCQDGCLVSKMFCQASKLDQMLTVQLNVLYAFVIRGTLSVLNRFVSDCRPQLLLTAVHCSGTQWCSLLPAGFQKQEIRTNVVLFFWWLYSWFNEQGSFRGSINLGIVGQRVWVPFYQPLVTDSQRSLFNEKGTWRLWVQGSQRNVLKPHKRAEERMDGDEMGDRETDDIFKLLSL